MAPPIRPADQAPQGEWLYKSQGQVFGPFSSARLLELIADRSLGAESQVSGSDGGWRALGSIPAFLVEIRKAEARARVEAEAVALRRRERIRKGLKATGLVLGALALVLLVAGLTWLVATWRDPQPAARRDLGQEVAVGTVRVAAQPAVADVDEIAVPKEGPPEPAPKRVSKPVSAPSRAGGERVAKATPGARPRGTAEGGDLVMAQYDVRRVQEAVARQQESLAPCLQDEVRRTPDLSGELPIEFAVGNDGKVSALWIHDPRFKSGPLHDCLLRKLHGWTFDPFPGQRPVVSLAFRLGSR